MLELGMRVTKRSGELEELSFDKILNRIRILGQEAEININYQQLVMKVITQLYDTISTTKIDELTAEQCASLVSQHPDYGKLAARIVVSNHQKNTVQSFSNVMRQLYEYVDSNGDNSPIISEKMWNYIRTHSTELDEMIVNNRDYLFDYFGFKTLEKSYLLKINKVIVERPQHMLLRAAVQIHSNSHSSQKTSLEYIKETYDLMSSKYFIHATPTLYNSCTTRPQLSSCFLLAIEDDSMEGIFNTIKDCALISKYAGGIGIHVHSIRSKGSHIRSTNGTSDGLVPMLRVFNSTAKYSNQSGRRNGSFAIYLETWHSDIFEFLDLKKNRGDEDMRARDLFYALWVSDLFMKRVKSDGDWSLMCPNECPGLSDAYGTAFEELYEQYEAKGKAKRVVKARELWLAILTAQIETSMPYLSYKDAANMKTNQKNLGTIKSSNLCNEVYEYSDKNETAVCNLASIALPSFVNEETKTYDFEKLHSVVKVAIKNLNNIIDVNFYPTDKTRRSNLRHRPVGLGIQGLADTFMKMDIPFESLEAAVLNEQIAETMYHAAVERSCELAIEHRQNILSAKSESRQRLMEYLNEYDYEYVQSQPEDCQCIGSYSTFKGSPASQGIFQFDMWNVKPSDRYDWNSLKEKVISNGIRNSLLIALMPTASTSQILGFNECFEPITSNIYSRRTLAGEFMVVNEYLMNDLIKIDRWNEDIKNNIIANNGSVQQFKWMSDHMRNKYKISWEMSMKTLIDMSAKRAPYICQSQSLNLWMTDPTKSKLTTMHFYAWEKGLKTGIYYLRRKGKHQAQQFTIDPEKKEKWVKEGQANEENEEEQECTACSA